MTKNYDQERTSGNVLLCMWYHEEWDMSEKDDETKSIKNEPTNLVQISQLHPLLIVRIEINTFLPPPQSRCISSSYGVLKSFFDVAHPKLNRELALVPPLENLRPIMLCSPN